MISQTEENYLKAIFKLTGESDDAVSTNQISAEILTSAASVTDMIKRLSKKGLIKYERYKGTRLSDEGRKIATSLIRKHRLWEVFLVEKLEFTWDEVHDIAEQLEHIKSEFLIERLDRFLGFPKFDPHGDPIPDKDGNFAYRKQVSLAQLDVGESGVVVGVNEHSTAFLRFLDSLALGLGAEVRILETFEYDMSMKVLVNQSKEQVLSSKISQNLFVMPGE
ncbi:MAG: metal-dependent transcriptional regulator [Bacteroidota bacterium]